MQSAFDHVVKMSFVSGSRM